MQPLLRRTARTKMALDIRCPLWQMPLCLEHRMSRWVSMQRKAPPAFSGNDGDRVRFFVTDDSPSTEPCLHVMASGPKEITMKLRGGQVRQCLLPEPTSIISQVARVPARFPFLSLAVLMLVLCSPSVAQKGQN